MHSSATTVCGKIGEPTQEKPASAQGNPCPYAANGNIRNKVPEKTVMCCIFIVLWYNADR